MKIHISDHILCHLVVREDTRKIIKRYEIHSVMIDGKIVAGSWSEAADFSEIFNAFNRNALVYEVQYRINKVHFELMLSDKQAPRILITLHEEDEEDEEDEMEWKYYKFSKVESLLVYNKLTKILNKCDFGM